MNQFTDEGYNVDEELDSFGITNFSERLQQRRAERAAVREARKEAKNKIRTAARQSRIDNFMRKEVDFLQKIRNEFTIIELQQIEELKTRNQSEYKRLVMNFDARMLFDMKWSRLTHFLQVYFK